ncbi:MAG TPA: hypothetical protein VGR45_11760 [Stellaceae bacterium]|nr:hypothetical protein [Stellaceae bacterium]
MEETIGECTNLHITYPAMVAGYLVLVRANRTLKDALEAAEPDAIAASPEAEASAVAGDAVSAASPAIERIAANDVAILPSGEPVDGIIRFHAALAEMTSRRGVRNEISRYEAIALALIEPSGENAGTVFPGYPRQDSPLRLERFFDSLYQRYDERFVFGAPVLADRRITPRLEWDPESPVFRDRERIGAAEWLSRDYLPRISSR